MSVTVNTVSEDSVKDYLRQIGRTALLTGEQEYELAERIEAGVLAQQRLDEKAAAAIELSAAERRELHRAIQDGRQAKDHMVRANLRLVVSIAKHYPIPTGMTLLDLTQEGTFGLVRAVEKFEHRRGLKFSTYATWWIKQSIGRALADQSRTIRIPGHVVEVLNRAIRTKRTLSQQLGRDATMEELAAELDLPVEQVRQVLSHGREPISLHTPVGDEDTTELGELLADRAPEPAVTVTDAAVHGQLLKVLSGLPEREGQVITLRYGLDGADPRTLEEVGRLFGVSRERIRQLEAKAMQKLRQPTRAQALEGLLG
ncbi:sigma-70 family RNA polymerase sigma factor [Nocardia sp. IFM 10818]